VGRARAIRARSMPTPGRSDLSRQMSWRCAVTDPHTCGVDVLGDRDFGLAYLVGDLADGAAGLVEGVAVVLRRA
jgi:hypothetical protein